MNSTERFSTRVENYVRYRPSYPPAVLSHLHDAGFLTDSSVVADICSGTGKLTQLFLDAGRATFAVEPNAPMRAAAENLFRGQRLFTSIAGTAEATGLPDRSVSLIAAGQAFHWFDAVKSRAEFARILQPAGGVALIWNQRNLADPLGNAYDELLRQHCPGYHNAGHHDVTDAEIAAFFAPGTCNYAETPNPQAFDFPAFAGRLQSSSYSPTEPAALASLLADLRKLFDRHARGGQVQLEQVTQMYLGRLN